MSIHIRDVSEHELDAVLALNNAAGKSILPMSREQLRFFFDCAAYFRVGLIDGNLAGFLIALTEDAEHASANFRWFKQRFEHFLYIDRIVIAKGHRGAGLGRMFYADLQSFAEVRSPRIACEVFLEPGNDIALLFHGTYGFNEVGQQLMPGIERRVSLLTKELCSWPWVQQTYYSGDHSRLPDLPWLAARHHHTGATRQATGS
ncbi:MAG: GNAT family N-acetyltransferase [Xanthomonadaceae bacterium]|nr:GNAT family N-acetyltransferase [Xanthomonadaceae bacterium]MDP2185956.1 GNAT family N-acetyltransferase [Xanthomonadales bacterium]MDZ4114843.1 GNAT family N-acetyltransferase [Xanthomonadaceae bacterium]MDZ4377913.1 GNAT family N-acetyltransferase [Xanthomonadaceae bacterium]